MLQRWSALGVFARLLAVAGSGCTFVGDLGQDSMSAGGSAGGSDDGVGEGGDATDGDVDTTLPMLPPLTNVRVRIVGDAANITFDAVDAAVDYRVYALPPNDAIHVGGDGVIVIDDGLYRCAGQREALYMLEDIVSPDEGWNDVAPAVRRWSSDRWSASPAPRATPSSVTSTSPRPPIACRSTPSPTPTSRTTAQWRAAGRPSWPRARTNTPPTRRSATRWWPSAGATTASRSGCR